MKLIIAGVSLDNNTKKVLDDKGYKILSTVSDGFDVIKSCREHSPDTLIINNNLELLDGISVSKIIKKENPNISVVFVLKNLNKEIISDLKKANSNGFIKYPFCVDDLISTIEFSNYINEEFIKLKKEKDFIEKKYEDRKVIDKAKGILMVNENINENEAYSKIRKYSMEKRVTMREIAEFITISNDFKIK